MGIELYSHQIEAINKLRNGSILCGDVGTGKSRTALVYYYDKVCGGKLVVNGKGRREPMSAPRDLYIITTAKKRDSCEWDLECAALTLSTNDDICREANGTIVRIDSWNNIKKYKDVTGAFFIFDEQRVVGSGAWVKAFLNIARKNQWILLSATPGDVWSDYIPVFVANGFYKNKTEFMREHAVFNRFSKFPKIDRYVETRKLTRYRNQVLVRMNVIRETQRCKFVVVTEYDKDLYSRIVKDRWNVYDNEPIAETGKLCYLMRRVVNEDPSRLRETEKIVRDKRRVIIFYNFSYELRMLRALANDMGWLYSEWNGEKHESIPDGKEWIYLVQYAAGAEGWNCITTDTIIFYSQNYSYRMTVQAAGRIDRMNTPFKKLYYYHLRSYASIDIAIARALKNKRNFNEKAFLRA